MLVQPYLFFDGRCEEAVTFYRDALGAKVETVMHFKDCPDTPPPGTMPPGSENKVMHACFRIGETSVMASDGHCQGHPSFQGFSLSITVPSSSSRPRTLSSRISRTLVAFSRPRSWQPGRTRTTCLWLRITLGGR